MTCQEKGCKRAPAYPDQAYCREHQPRWVPEWKKRLTGRDETGRLVA